MTIHNLKVYECDFCYLRTSDTDELINWFRFTTLRNGSGYAPYEENNPTEYKQMHVCNECGKRIHMILDKCGVHHEYYDRIDEQKIPTTGNILVY